MSREGLISVVISHHEIHKTMLSIIFTVNAGHKIMSRFLPSECPFSGCNSPPPTENENKMLVFVVKVGLIHKHICTFLDHKRVSVASTAHA